jgi:hypothetical protein
MSLPEWEVTSDPPTIVEASDVQQAADERVRLELETPADDRDSRPRLFVRPAGSEDQWTMVYPAWPDLTPEDL